MTGARLSARTGSPSVPPGSRVYYTVQAELDVYTIPEIMPFSLSYQYHYNPLSRRCQRGGGAMQTIRLYRPKITA